MSYQWELMELEESLDGTGVIEEMDYFYDGENLHPTISRLSTCRAQLECLIGELRWWPDNDYSKHLLSESGRVLLRYDDFFRQAKKELSWLSCTELSPVIEEALRKFRRARKLKSALEDI